MQGVFGFVYSTPRKPIRVCSDTRQDSRSKRLYFVDIDQKKLYTYEPSSGTIGYDVFDHKITAIALLEKGEGVSAYRVPAKPTYPHIHLPRARIV